MRRRTKRTDDPVLDDYSPSTTGDALDAAEGYVAASADTGRSCDAGGTKFAPTLEALCCWAEKFSLIRLESEFAFFGRRPDGYGDEHQAWFDEESGLWFKATHANRFGLAWGRTGSATVREYLTRQLLQNRYFGDDIRLIALINAGGKPRILISQPHIAGESAGYDEIQDWFRFLGFARLDCDGSIAWYLESENLLIADAHEGNVIKARSLSKGTVLLPIDLNIVQPNGGLLAGIKALLPDPE
jgi:hypothetical protein